jgi:mono/diheme cytochrome c family protein
MNFKIYYSIILMLTLSLVGCKPKTFKEPVISLDAYKIVDGFDLKVVASEPFIEAPVVMDFDNKGRMWIVEMKGYMQNLEGTGEDEPNGVISIMEDLDNDGVTDHAKVFLDSLVLPRAIAHVYGGLLYAEPPNLWFVDIKKDKPANKVLVDSIYSYGGNVEHQPNGLMMNIDNWIYNAKSNFRYQRSNGKWIKEPTTYRGQWGISKDNFGRLYYNTNATQLVGDYVLPNTVINNPYYKPRHSVNKILTPNQKVYPLHPTSVNRGYSKGTLGKDSLLVNVTAACGPLVYRGGQFEASYNENVFVCVPEANLIKRNILNFQGDKITANQPWDTKEFIASTDEGFRPVNLFNGPDGSMYIVDMHRGIIQDKAYLSPYLLNRMRRIKLDTIVGMGRILKVTSQANNENKIPNFEEFSAVELVDLLNHTNGWVRDRTQQILIEKNQNAAVPILVKLLQNSNNELAKLHALYTLKGMGALTFDILKNILNTNSSVLLSVHGFVLIENFASEENVESMLEFIKKGLLRNQVELDFYAAASLGSWLQYSKDDFYLLLVAISDKYGTNSFVQEGILNSIRGRTEEFKTYVDGNEKNISRDLISKLLETAIQNKEDNRETSIYSKKTVNTDSRTAGYNTFKTVCAACHGIDGNGIEEVAPPLNGSEFIEGSRDRLALIILHGLSGPIHVNGVLYKLNGVMPGLAKNSAFSDSDISNIISYLNNAFTKGGKGIGTDRIRALRDKKPKNGEQFTEEELLKLIL